MPEDVKKKVIDLGPDIIDKLVNDKDEFEAFVKAVREGTLDKFFDRDKKSRGGSVGSLVAKDIRQPDKELQKLALIEKIKKYKFSKGGPVHPLETLDQEGRLKWWVNLLENIASNSWEDYLLDRAREDLERFQKQKAK